MILEFIFRWAHVVFGIVWIGMLYYFNFVQTEYFKEAEKESALPDAKAKLAPRALWWFRWGAMFTFLTGLILLHYVGAFSNFVGGALIWVGALAGTLMFLNVWLIIWPNQRIVIASNQAVAGGGEADPAAAGAAPKAGLASRTNTLFSIPMLWFMGYKRTYGASIYEADGQRSWDSNKMEAEVFSASSAPRGSPATSPRSSSTVRTMFRARSWSGRRPSWGRSPCPDASPATRSRPGPTRLS